MTEIPDTQYAVQLTGPSELRLNKSKKVDRPGPHQVLVRIRAVGLCFSDVKLLKQFSGHSRKGPVVDGIAAEVLEEIPSYRPGDEPAVPGHEAMCEIVAVGEKVAHHHVGQRALVQTDYRWLKTASSNAAFGYNFEGALQEYVIMDERVIMDPATGESLLIPVDAEHSASAVALVEPWACVEDSYVSEERRGPLGGGKMLVVAEAGLDVSELGGVVGGDSAPGEITAVCDETQRRTLEGLGVPVTAAEDVKSLPDFEFDDIVYFGADADTIEAIDDKSAAGAITAVITFGREIPRRVNISVGRMHYGNCRWVGTTTASPKDAYGVIPENGQLRRGDKIMVIGAAGPMGQMHVIRALCSGTDGVSVTGTDLDDGRLQTFEAKARPLAEANNIDLKLINPQNHPAGDGYTYLAIMAPVPGIVAQAIDDSGPSALINIFAGIPADKKHPVDMDAYIRKSCFMFGTSGSVIRDMKIVLDKLNSGVLDTNSLVDAVTGMAGAIDGMDAVQERTLAGKIVVYPQLHELPLTPLADLAEKYPSVAERLDNGIWTKAAEEELLQVAK